MYVMLIFKEVEERLGRGKNVIASIETNRHKVYKSREADT